MQNKKLTYLNSAHSQVSRKGSLGGGGFDFDDDKEDD